jgi:glycosyltransferase involved in cell wall biosynthesis
MKNDGCAPGGGIYQKHPSICISVGGGTPIKNNIPVCEAIKRLNENDGMDLRFIIIGPPFGNGENLRSYTFVTYYELLPHSEVMEMMSESSLYIQNSIFDSFPNAVLEAIDCGCSILVSSNVGVAEVLPSITDGDIINDPNNVNEIADKIKKILECPNAERIREGIADEAMSNHAASRNLYALLTKLEREG